MERVTTDAAGLARRILDDSLYLTLATADGDGRPWASPVYYARAADGELLWVSEPGTRHSTPPSPRGPRRPSTSRATRRRSRDLTWSPEGDVTGDARLRLYRLRALGVWVLDGIGDDREGDRRIPVEL
jgi:hypothetical protein